MTSVIRNDLTAMQLAFEKASALNTRFAYFDPLDSLSSADCAAYKARMVNSYAWTIDTIVVNKARSVYYRLAQEFNINSRDIDAHNEFIASLAVRNAGDFYAEDLGYEENSGTMQQLSMLLDLSTKLHDYAETLAASAELAYKPKSFDELMRTERLNVDNELIRIEAEFACADITDEALRKTTFDEYVKLALEADVAVAKERNEANTRAIPAILNIIESVKRLGDATDVQFHQLDTELQGQILRRAVRIPNSVYMQLRTWRSLRPDLMLMIRDDKRITAELREALTAPKFSVTRAAIDADIQARRAETLAAAEDASM